VLTDDIFEPVEQWEEVQSVDMITMQKVWCWIYMNLMMIINDIVGDE
jgi:hypothetical protein